MDAVSINFGALCKYNPSGSVISVIITADEYDYLCTMTNREKKYEDAVEYKVIEYPVFLELIAETQVAEWNRNMDKK